MASASPAVIIERVKEIHRSFQAQIDTRRAQMVESSTTTLGAADGKSSPSPPTDITNPLQRYYAPNSFVGQWLDMHPDTTLKDISTNASAALPIRSFLGPPAVPLPTAEPAGFTGLVHASAPQAVATESPMHHLQLGEDEGDADAPMDELVALGSAAEVKQWLKAVRELQAEGRGAASDWSVAEQQAVEAMVKEELAKTQEALKVEEDRGYQRLATLQTIAEQLGSISRRSSFNAMPASDATVDEWLEALREKVDDWYLNRREATAHDASKSEGKGASRKQKVNQISSGLASAAAHEGILLTAQQLDQVLQAFYEQDQKRGGAQGNGENNTIHNASSSPPAASPVNQRAVARLNKQLAHTLAREDAFRRVMTARNKALVAEIARLNAMLEAAASYGIMAQQMATAGSSSGPLGMSAFVNGPPPLSHANSRSVSPASPPLLPPARSNATVSPAAAPLAMRGGNANNNNTISATTAAEDGVMNLVQMMAERSASKGGGDSREDYGVAAVLRNRGAVESLNSITLVVAEALSRKRMRALQGQVEKLRAALVSMKSAFTSTGDRLQVLAVENVKLKAELDEYSATFAKWKQIKDQQDAERRRLAREGGTELSTQKEVMNVFAQRTAAVLGDVSKIVAEATSAMIASAALCTNRRLSNTVAGEAAELISSSGSSSSRRDSIKGTASDTTAPTPPSAQHQRASVLMGSMVGAVRDWVAFAIGTMPSDSARMLLGDLERRVEALARQQQQQQEGGGGGEQQRGISAQTLGLNTRDAVTAATAAETDGLLVAQLSQRLDHTLCEVKDKLREERFMRSTIQFFVKAIECMCDGTFDAYEKDLQAEEEEDAEGSSEDQQQRLMAMREGQGTTLTGVKNPLEKLKPSAGMKMTRVFPPKSVTTPDTAYAYAWQDETSALQKLFARLKSVLTNAVERTETTNAIVGALARYNAEGPAYRGGTAGAGTTTLPSITGALSPPLTAATAATSASKFSPSPFSPLSMATGGGGGSGRDVGQQLGDPHGLLAMIQDVNAKEASRGLMMRGGVRPPPVAGRPSTLVPLPTPTKSRK